MASDTVVIATARKSSLSQSYMTRAPLIRFGLIAPCLAFMFFVFVWPIAAMLVKGVYSPEVRDALPLTTSVIGEWNGQNIPADNIFEALLADLKAADRRAIAEAGRRLNYEIPGYRTILIKTAARADSAAGPAQQALIAIDPHWAQPAYWRVLQRASSAITPYYLLAAVDLEQKDDGSIGSVSEDRAIFIDVLLRSLGISAVVTVICLLLAFPVAFHITTVSTRWRGILLLLVLLPFWTSLLVRTSAWVVLLQDNGLINSFLIWAGITNAPIQMIFNRTGVYIAFVHVMLPFMVMPLYSIMSGISKDYTRAAYSLGASAPRTFFKIYLPLVWPGVWSGCLLTFVICIGYYVTPLLVGGSRDQMLSYFIAFYTKQTVNWGLASALAIVLSVCVLVILGLYGLLGRKSQFVVKG